MTVLGKYHQKDGAINRLQTSSDDIDLYGKEDEDEEAMLKAL
jgi:hypothetical protein